MEETIVSTAERASIRIGCSGWVYKHWRGLFYPEGLPQTRWFERYAEEFDTVEINNSFYHLPKPATFEKWRKQAPPGFCYAVKANRFLTQAKKLKDCEEPMERMMSAVRHLGDRLGPMLYQLPPSLKINLERLETFLKNPSGRRNQRIRVPRHELVRPRDLRSPRPLRHWFRRARHARIDERADRRRPNRLCPLPRRPGEILGPIFRRTPAFMDRLAGRPVEAGANLLVLFQ